MGLERQREPRSQTLPPRRLVQHPQQPAPGDGSQTELEAADPVGSLAWWVLGEPGLEMRLDELEPPRLAIEQPAEGGSEQILMPIELPERLVITDHRGIEVIDAAPVQTRCLRATHGLTVPARRISHHQ